MPVITMTVVPLDAEKKRRLAEGLTRTAVEVTGIPAEKFIVFIDEKPWDSIAVGGQMLSDVYSVPADTPHATLDDVMGRAQ